MDKPLAVQTLRHVFQDLDAAGVVLDQVVVGGEHGGDLALDGERRQCYLEVSQDVKIYVRHTSRDSQVMYRFYCSWSTKIAV